MKRFSTMALALALAMLSAVSWATIEPISYQLVQNSGSGAGGEMTAQEIKDAVSSGGSVDIALITVSNTCEDYYFSASVAKSQSLNATNVWTVTASGTADCYLLQNKQGAYIKTTSTTINQQAVETTTDVNEAALLKIVDRGNSGADTTPYTGSGYHNTSFVLNGTSNGYINVGGANANSKWHTGTGGFSCYSVKKVVEALLPFEVTTDPSNPKLYAIHSGRGDYYFTKTSGNKIHLNARATGDHNQLWYFVEDPQKAGYINIVPYTATSSLAASSTYSTAGASKIDIVANNSGYNWGRCWKLVDATGGWYAFQLYNGNTNTLTSLYLSNFGGVGNDMGVYGTLNDGGTKVQFEAVTVSSDEWSVEIAPANLGGGIVVNSQALHNGDSFNLATTPVEDTDFTVTALADYTATATVNAGTNTVRVEYVYNENAFNGEGVYRFSNNNFADNCNMYEVESDYQAKGLNTATGSNSLWLVKSAAGNGQAPYTIRNLNTGRYLQLVATNNTNWYDVTTTDIVAARSQYYLSYSATEGGFYTVSTTSTLNNNTCVHMGNNNDRIVCWNTGVNSGGSRWELHNMNMNVVVYDIVVTGLSDNNSVSVTSSVTPLGKSSLKNGEAFMFTSGTSVDANSFTAEAVNGYTSSISVSNNVITVTYTGGAVDPTPQDGHVYNIVNHQQNGDTYMFTNNNGTLNASSSATGAALSDMFVCKKIDDKYVFISASTGDYLLFNAVAATNPFNTTGFEAQYNGFGHNENGFQINLHNDVSTGYVSIGGLRNRLTDANSGWATWYVSSAGVLNANGGANSNTYNSNGSTYFTFEEVNGVNLYNVVFAEGTPDAGGVTCGSYSITKGNHTQGLWIPSLTAEPTVTAIQVEDYTGTVTYSNGTYTVTYTLVGTPITVDLVNGSFTKGNQAGTYNSEWTANGSIALRLDCGVNNMEPNGTNIMINCGTSGTSTNSFVAPTGWKVAGYRFDFVAGNSDAVGITLTANGTQYTVSNTTQNVNVTGLDSKSVSFTISGANKPVLFTNMVVTLVESDEEPQIEVFATHPGDVVYRIPAIATTHDGKVIAVADYRYGGADIGFGSVELRRRVSNDNGQTWGEIVEFTHGVYQNVTKPDYNAAYGDPCIVADCESNKQMIISCSGNTTFPGGSREVHQGIMRFYSTDNGETWGDPVNLESMFYGFFDSSTRGPIRSMFIGSGKITQSRIIKNGSYYRLYCSGLVKDVNGTNCNYVFYSDDFGGTWHVLGDINTPAIPSGDEPKAEELPDGSVLCSSRVGGGRHFNIYTFTNSATGEGSWGTSVKSTNTNNGTWGADCNGEIMVVPATRTSDNKDVYVALQSIPVASGRTNVGIYYKGLEDFASFSSPAVFAANWEGYHQASEMGSAYSTMTLMANNHIGFLYEESTYGPQYTIVFKDYTLEQITGGAYSYNPTLNRVAWVKENVQGKIDNLFDTCTGTHLGMLDAAKESTVTAALNQYETSGLQSDYEAINVALENARIQPEARKNYMLTSKQYSTLSIAHNNTRFCGLATDREDATQHFMLISAGNGLWKIYNPAKKLYFGNAPAMYSEVPTTANAAEAGLYKVQSSLNGETVFISQSPTNSSIPAIHMDASKKLVPWSIDAEGSHFLVDESKVEILTISSVGRSTFASEYPLDFEGTGVTPYWCSGLTENNKNLVMHDITKVPAVTGLYVVGDEGTYVIPAATEPIPVIDGIDTNCLIGVVPSTLDVVDGLLEIGQSGTEGNVTLTNYILQNQPSKGGLKFYKVNQSGNKVAVNRAYLQLITSDGSSAKEFYDIEGDATAINGVDVANAKSNAHSIFDLSGRKVGADYKGVVIVNGRKEMRK